MFIMDVPNIPAQEPPLIVADASASQGAARAYDRVIGVCHLSANPFVPKSAVNVLNPAMAIKNYYRVEEKFKITGQFNISVLQMPLHGILENEGEGYYAYYPEKGYLGNDQASLLVEVGGKKIKMEYFFRVMQSVSPEAEGEPSIYEQGYCPTKARVWKISSTTDASGNNFITAVDYQTYVANINGVAVTDTVNSKLDAETVISIIGASILNSINSSTSGINVNIADLPFGAIGQATGTSITLDDNAAGHGWFIDSTPSDNSEFLPTADANVWVAKQGSAAYGKMDMLSVLLHEYGHALGIEHSADSHDYMAASLTPGVRRLPTADELALMQKLIAQQAELLQNTPDTSGSNGPSQLPLLPLGGFGLAFLGRLRSTRYGSLGIEPDYSSITTEFQAIANAQFMNGSFISTNGLPPDDGWNKQGQVTIANGIATLQEVSGSQTRLNQVFMVKPTDRYLSFTLSGAALNDPLPNPPPGGRGDKRRCLQQRLGSNRCLRSGLA